MKVQNRNTPKVAKNNSSTSSPRIDTESHLKHSHSVPNLNSKVESIRKNQDNDGSKIDRILKSLEAEKQRKAQVEQILKNLNTYRSVK